MTRGTPVYSLRLSPEDRAKLELYQEHYDLPDASKAVRHMIASSTTSRFDVWDIINYLSGVGDLSSQKRKLLKDAILAAAATYQEG